MCQVFHLFSETPIVDIGTFENIFGVISENLIKLDNYHESDTDMAMSSIWIPFKL